MSESNFEGTAPSSSNDSQSPEDLATSSVQGPRKERVKIDGVEEEVDIESLKRDYQKYKASEKRFQEASELRKAATQERELINQFLGKAQQGDLSWLKGLVPKEVLTQWAESELLEHIEWQKMPEVERRAILAEQRAQELEGKVQEYTQTREREQASRVEEQAYQSVEQDIVQAVTEIGYNVKVTPRLIRRIAEQLAANLEASNPNDPQYQPMTAKSARDRALKGLMVDAQELLQTLPAEEALKLLPPNLRDAIRKADVQTAMSQMPQKVRKGTELDEAPQRKSKLKRMSTEDFFNRLDKRFGK